MRRKLIDRITYLFLLVLLAPIFHSCNNGNEPPRAILSAFPQAGNLAIVFAFSAEGSSDDRDYEIGLSYRWDFEGDGIWDTEYSRSSAIAHRFPKSGQYSVIVEVRDLDGLTATACDTIEVYQMNTDVDTLVDPRDGNRYKIVKIHGQWWFAENMRFGLEITLDWEQTDNDTVEFYRDHRIYGNDTIGGVYHWREAMNYQITDPQGICPDGWHIPSLDEWESLFTPYSITYLFEYYRHTGHSGLNLDLKSFAVRTPDNITWVGTIENNSFAFLSSSFKVPQDFGELYPGICIFDSEGMHADVGFWGAENSHSQIYGSVRCLKNTAN